MAAILTPRVVRNGRGGVAASELIVCRLRGGANRIRTFRPFWDWCLFARAEPTPRRTSKRQFFLRGTESSNLLSSLGFLQVSARFWRFVMHF